MQRTEEAMELGGKERKQGTERKRVEAVVETLATVGCRCESVAEVAHDARNMVTALGLYCDLLEEPGVLAVPFTHYGNELRLVAAASRRLVEKLVTLDGSQETNTISSINSGSKARLASSAEMSSTGVNPETRRAWRGSARLGSSTAAGHTAAAGPSSVAAASAGQLEPGRAERRLRQTPGRWDLMPAAPIENMAAELLANHNLLAALAGPSIELTVDVDGGAGPVRLTGEDLTRVLVNLVKNSAEAMPEGGRIQIELCELPAAAGTAEALALTIEDNGPGIPEEALDKIFNSGYTTRIKGAQTRGSWPVIHRGLGLSITRSIVEAAGGRVVAAQGAHGGARFAIELPLRRGGN
jgi:signal transduction histidine kinase